LAPGTHTPPQLVPAHASAHVVVAHWPFEPHVCTCVSLMHCVAPGVQTPVQAPLTHAWFVQVATGESDRRSGPHCTAVVALLHTSWPGLALAHTGSIGWHVP
jgi:hypothetical protein